MRRPGIVVCRLAVFIVALGQTLSSFEQSITIAMPVEWVAFSADVRHSYDAAVTTGTFHRRRDGSSAWMLDTPEGVAITIHNLQTRLTYTKLGDRDWAARPVADGALDPPARVASARASGGGRDRSGAGSRVRAEKCSFRRSHVVRAASQWLRRGLKGARTGSAVSI